MRGTYRGFFSVLAFVFASPVSEAADFSAKLPYMVHGTRTANLVGPGSRSLYDVPAMLQNSGGTLFTPSNIRFLDFYKNSLVFGMQANSNYFYVWQGSPTTTKPVCEGNLENRSGVAVTAEALSHVVVGDFDGSGSLQVAGIHGDVSYYYVWKIGAKVGAATQPCAGHYVFTPAADGPLYGSGGAAVIGNSLSTLVPTDWNNDDRNELFALPLSGTAGLGWQAAAGSDALQFWRNFPLQASWGSVNTSDVTEVVDNRAASGGPLTASRNIAGGTELILPLKWGAGMLRNDGSFSAIQNCQGSPQLCQGATLLVSLDEAYQNGPVNSYKTYPNAVSGLFDQLASLRKAVGGAGMKMAVIVNPAHADKANLVNFLDLLAAKNIDFVLDEITSDSQTAALSYQSFPSVFEPVEGVSLSIAPINAQDTGNIGYYINRYTNLRGFRIMEQLGVDQVSMICRYWAVAEPTSDRFKQTCWNYLSDGDAAKAPFVRTLQPGTAYSPRPPAASALPIAGWTSPSRDVPTADSWQRHVRDLARIAHGHGLYVVWSDNNQFDPYQFYHVGSFQDGLLRALETERTSYLAFEGRISSLFPNTIVALYDNNEGVKVTSMPGFSSVQETPRNFRFNTFGSAPGAVPATLGWGLSNQSWTADQHRFWNEENLPSEELAAWTTTTLNAGAKWIEIEPLWYFFDWPRPVKFQNLTSAQATNKCIGQPAPTLNAQLNAFGVKAGIVGCAP